MLPLPSLEFLLIAGRAVALALAFITFAWAFARWKRAAARDTQRVFEQLDLLRADMLELAEQIKAVGARAQEREAAEDNAARFALMPSQTGPRGYEVAVRLAKSGATREELISNCGISRHEAELLLRLHGAAAKDSNAAKDPKTSVQEKAKPVAPENATVQPLPPARRRLSVVG